MSVQRDRKASWGQHVGGRASRVAVAAALALALGCAERPAPAAGDTAPAPASAQTAAPSAPALPARPTIAGTRLPSRRPLPAPVAMPGGGVRIDMRGITRHARAIERQPDGTVKHVCVDDAEMAPAAGSR
jgi:hypothetical protein